MRRQLWIGALLAISLGACYIRSKAKLEIPEEKLMPILVDLAIVQSGDAGLPNPDSVSQIHLDTLAHMHQVEISALQHDLRELALHPKTAEAIYQKVLDSLNHIGN